MYYYYYYYYLAELNWQSLAEHRRLARLTMFYKIHYHLVAVDMPLTMKMHFFPTRTENTTAYNILSSRCDYHRFSFSQEQSESGIHFLNTSPVLQLLKHSKMPLLLPEVGHWVLHCIVFL